VQVHSHRRRNLDLETLPNAPLKKDDKRLIGHIALSMAILASCSRALYLLTGNH
jgi:hypothetical protein